MGWFGLAVNCHPERARLGGRRGIYTDKKIDEEVYKLYGLTEEEIRVVERKEKE